MAVELFLIEKVKPDIVVITGDVVSGWMYDGKD